MCVFCNIINGSIPSYKVYEDSEYLAFLDISQTTIGHTLVVPKKHFANIFEIDENTSKKIFQIVILLTKKIKQTLNINDINILINNGTLAGQTVNHFHIHLIPRYENDQFEINFPHNKLANEELNKLAIKLSS